jgi:cold-inducible RNA-binding protein
MAKRLYVGNLPWEATEDQIRDMFAGVGTVETVEMPVSPHDGKFRGFAFVEMSTDEEAQKAIDTLDKTDMGGRTVFVAWPRPKEDRGPRRDFGGNRGGGNGGRRDFGGNGGGRRDDRF